MSVSPYVKLQADSADEESPGPLTMESARVISISHVADEESPGPLTMESARVISISTWQAQVGDDDSPPWITAMFFLAAIACYCTVMWGCLDTANQLESIGNTSMRVVELIDTLALAVVDRATDIKGAADSFWDSQLDFALTYVDKGEKLVSQYISNVTSLGEDLALQLSANSFASAREQICSNGLVKFQAQQKEFLDGAVEAIELSTMLIGIGRYFLADVDTALQSFQDIMVAALPTCQMVAIHSGPNVTKFVHMLSTISIKVDAFFAELPINLDNVTQVLSTIQDAIHWLQDLAATNGTAFCSRFLDVAQAGLSTEVVLQMETVSGQIKNYAHVLSGAVQDFIVQVHRRGRQQIHRLTPIIEELKSSQIALAFDLLLLKPNFTKMGLAAKYAKVGAYFLGLFPILLIGSCLIYILYIEFIWENENIREAFRSTRSCRRREKCFWKVVHYLFQACERARQVTLFSVVIVFLYGCAILMMVVSGVLCFIGIVRFTAASACQTIPLFSDDSLCSKNLRMLGETLRAELVGNGGCQKSNLLICDSFQLVDVFPPMIASVLGLLPLCCVPVRMIIIRTKAWSSVDQARELAAEIREEEFQKAECSSVIPSGAENSSVVPFDVFKCNACGATAPIPYALRLRSS